MAQIAQLSQVWANPGSMPRRIILAEGWSRRGVAFLAGTIGALALPPFDFAPAMAIPLTTAVWLIDGAVAASGFGGPIAPFLSAASAGWWLGFGYFVASLWWLGSAMLVEAEEFAWAIPLAVLGLPAALAFFPALGFALARLLWSPGSMRVFALAAGLGASEWLRGHLFTGFPWNDFGMALAQAGPLGQGASLVGLHGLDLAAIAIFAAPATLVDRPWRLRDLAANHAARAAAALLVTLFVFGALRLATHPTNYAPGVKLRLMQPNLAQDAKFRPENGPDILRHYLTLSDRSTGPASRGIADITHLIWPESAFPYVVTREPEAFAAITRALQGKVLITGAARLDGDGDGRRGQLFNAIQVFQDGRIVDTYDKAHLVPFGEYLPLEEYLQPFGITQLVPGTWDRGQSPRRLTAPGLPLMSPLVCYEAIFSGDATPAGVGGQRPKLLLNLTNDGWFGRTPGPYQHFAQARLRAIEEGLPLIRVANTGISAIIDPYGRVLASLPLGEEGVLDGRLPEAAPEPLFARRGGFMFAVLLMLSTLAALAGRRSA
jgi:apolipoprotein N-acyltransferase